MGRVFLANAFSPNMLGLSEERPWASVCIKRLEASEWAIRVALALGSLDCAIGHQATQQLASLVLWHFAGHRMEARCERKAITLNPGDTVYILQPSTRLPEGKVLGYDELRKLMEEGKLAFYAVHYGPC